MERSDMIERYESRRIKEIWSDENKLILWLRVELAVINAKVKLGQVEREIYIRISRILKSKPIDVAWWKAKDKEISHDLNAFIDERVRHLPLGLAPYFHGEEELTSYDVEEPAFATMLMASVLLVERDLNDLINVLRVMALKYRYTVMMGRTHGQEAVLQTFGKRCLTWVRALEFDLDQLRMAKKNLRFSKISGAVGNYGSIDPEVEKEALKILSLKPFYGATQIMPRELYDPLAGALCRTVKTLSKIGLDIRLGARSGNPICQEPFGKKQKGSSAMPGKKNTISTEKVAGMSRLATGYSLSLLENIETWEERAIEQSSVERIAWPDLFHVTLHAIDTMSKVLKGLKVYPDNMLLEVVNSRGCYAANEVKKFLAKIGAAFGLTREEAYRITQLAAFNIFKPSSVLAEELRRNPLDSLEKTDGLIMEFRLMPKRDSGTIREIIMTGALEVSEELGFTQDDVNRWNDILTRIFQRPENQINFSQLFSVPYLLRHEDKLYKEIIGV